MCTRHGSNHSGKLLRKLHGKIKDKITTHGQVTLIGDSNTRHINERLHAEKHLAFKIEEAKQLCHELEIGDTKLLHVGINDIKDLVKNTIFINAQDKKRIAEDISGKNV